VSALVEEAKTAAIARAAEEYLAKTQEELLWLLETTWTELQHGDSSQTRAGATFWTRSRDRLVAKILAQHEPASVTTGMVADYVLEWADKTAIDVDRYELPITLLVALVKVSLKADSQ
jgi:hypothetical protein